MFRGGGGGGVLPYLGMAAILSCYLEHIVRFTLLVAPYKIEFKWPCGYRENMFNILTAIPLSDIG